METVRKKLVTEDKSGQSEDEEKKRRERHREESGKVN
jgi:hypothetical protein